MTDREQWMKQLRFFEEDFIRTGWTVVHDWQDPKALMTVLIKGPNTWRPDARITVQYAPEKDRLGRRVHRWVTSLVFVYREDHPSGRVFAPRESAVHDFLDLEYALSWIHEAVAARAALLILRGS